MWKPTTVLIAALLLAGCNAEAPTISEPETAIRSSNGYNFSKDGDVFNIKTGEEFSILLDLPEGITDSTILWLPEEGGFGPHLKIVKSFRSFEDTLYYTEHQFRGAEPGQLVVTFAPKKGPKAIHDERRVITFNVSD